MKKLLVLLVIISSATFAQSESATKNKIDSLKRRLEVAREDTAKALLCAELSREYVFSKPDSGYYYASKGLSLSRKINYENGIAGNLFELSIYFRITGASYQGIQYATHALAIFKTVDNVKGVILCTNMLAWLSQDQKEYRRSIDYASDALHLSEENNNYHIEYAYTTLAESYEHLNILDSALYFGEKAEAVPEKESASWKLRVLGDIHSSLNNYSSSLQYYNEGIAVNTLSKDSSDIYIGMARVFTKTGQTDSAIYYLEKALRIATEGGFLFEVQLASESLAKIYRAKSHGDKALAYLQISTDAKDSLFSQEKVKQFQSFAFDEKLRQQEMEFEKKQYHSRMRINVLLLLIGFILILAVILYRNNKKALALERSEKEKQLAEMKRNATELEMQALRAQMNPHFIFNCLNSINRFILHHDAVSASGYLIKFSRLIRMVLNNSKEPMITLEAELECLKLYIEMEQLRFENAFSYSVSLDQNLDPEEAMLPPLLFQPFVENAIWHGLMGLPEQQSNRNKEGKIAIDIKTENGLLLCSVEDNGVGRKKAAELGAGKEKKRSLGLHITMERMRLFGIGEQNKTKIEVVDLVDDMGNASGTRVDIHIPLRTLGQSENIESEVPGN